ncbi:MAG: chlorite dismutase family protein [Phycisphaeraceae bacterium]|nr:chlorite dismutase family protein [Phycisphaeraceae bacterium]
MERPQVKAPDISEKGQGGQSSDERLFMQLLAFDDCPNPSELVEAAKQHNLNATVYEDVNDPTAAAMLTWTKDPADFVTKVRPAVQALGTAVLNPAYTMLGRTYSIGYESDLDEVLVDRPIRHAANPAWPWAVWYPLRRKGEFSRLDRETQMAILKEHGTIGMGFGAGDFGHDIRLASHGLDANDNDFTIGLVGKELAPLSILVQTMRKTQQTALYIEHLGPFFVGHAVWRSTD